MNMFVLVIHKEHLKQIHMHLQKLLVGPLNDIFYSWTLYTSLYYCWWTKSCTTKDDDYPIIYRVLTIPGGAGFRPSTVVCFLIWESDIWHCQATSIHEVLDKGCFAGEVSCSVSWPETRKWHMGSSRQPAYFLKPRNFNKKVCHLQNGHSSFDHSTLMQKCDEIQISMCPKLLPEISRSTCFAWGSDDLHTKQCGTQPEISQGGNPSQH